MTENERLTNGLRMGIPRFGSDGEPGTHGWSAAWRYSDRLWRVARRTVTWLPLLVLFHACAGNRAQPPYPAFIQADELPDVFVAALPGVRAKQFAGNPQTRRSSNRIVLPADWSGTTGGSPDKSLELYVLRGELRIGDLTLRPGAYAFFPAGYRGANFKTGKGAEILYFVDDANVASVIGTPLIASSDSLGWRPLSSRDADRGLAEKELRRDPGSGARTWLLRVTPEATTRWQSRTRSLEAYLVSGRYRGVECVAGRPVPGEYRAGGYFLRPPGAVHGGPDEKALETSVWLLREHGESSITTADACLPPG